MKTTILLSAALAAFALAQPAAAQGAAGGPGKGPGFKQKADPDKIVERFDSDGDGKISKTEAEAGLRGHLARVFDKVDANADGFITADELREKGKQVRERAKEKRGMWKDMDADGSGSLSYEEVELSGNERLLQHFGQIDADGDGELTPDELRQLRQNRKKGPPSAE